MMKSSSGKFVRRSSLTLCTASGIYAYTELFSSRPASALLFSDFSAYAGSKVGSFLNSVGASGLAVPIEGLIGLIPWVAVVVVCGIIAWGAIDGYKEYQQQNFAGLTEAALRSIVAVVLIMIADKATSFLTT